MMYLCKLTYRLITLGFLIISGCSSPPQGKLSLIRGVDESAGGGESFIVLSPTATYYLDKVGGGLSSLVDKDSVDWLGFNSAIGSGHKGEYRGFPNAIHNQDGNYFHAMNAGTDSSSSTIEKVTPEHISIKVTSGNKQWEGLWDFYPDHCDFTMTKISKGYHYWVQYEGVPGGAMDSTDFWYASVDTTKHPITKPFLGDLTNPEWMAFGDETLPRTLYLLHHTDDTHPDNYAYRPDMTVLGFGRQNKDKFLDTPQTFSIGFIESTKYREIEKVIRQILE